MVTKEDIKKLAGLARIEISENEIESLTSEIDSILNYVGEIKNATGDMERVVPKLRNVMRDDEVTRESGEYTEKLLSNAPMRDKNYLKVKKIL
jgi:aspartyl-tRNA(Asn)/glutamyl-tRNA(Gln) amidotransferase subunit C